MRAILLPEIHRGPEYLTGEKPMATAFRNVENAKEEIAQLHVDILPLERRVDTLSESPWKTLTELFGPDRPACPALQEAALSSKLQNATTASMTRNP
jgi:hypothetical protein